MTVLTENFLRLRTRQQDVTNVTALNFCNCDLSDISVLSQCRRLVTCSLAVNQITAEQMRAFSHLPALRELSLRSNNIEDLFVSLEHLRPIKSLRKLWLCENPFFDRHGFSEETYRKSVFQLLPQLEYLDNLPFDAVPSATPVSPSIPIASGLPPRVPSPVYSPPVASSQSHDPRPLTEILRLLPSLTMDDLQVLQDAVQLQISRKASSPARPPIVPRHQASHHQASRSLDEPMYMSPTHTYGSSPPSGQSYRNNGSPEEQQFPVNQVRPGSAERRTPKQGSPSKHADRPLLMF